MYVVWGQVIVHDSNLTCPQCKKVFQNEEKQLYHDHTTACSGTTG